MSRQNYQKEILQLSEKYNNLLLSWATGVGKSLAAILVQEQMKAAKTYIFVAETAHILNWEEEYIKHNKLNLLNNTTIVCYDSLHKYVNTKVDLIINDECHHITDLRGDYLKTISTKKVLNLSATTTYIEKERLEYLWGSLKVHTISLNSAIQESILIKPTIYIIPLQLDNVQRNETIIVSKNKSPTSEITCLYPQRNAVIKNPNNSAAKIIIKATQKEKYDYLTEQIDVWKYKYMTSRVEYIKIKWLKAGSDRKNYLSSLKTPYINIVVNKIKTQKFICFCGSIEQATLLGGKHVIHSKLSKKERNLVLLDFKNSKINSIFAINMLKEGVNLSGIETGIISQLDGFERSFIQKSGRALRNETNPSIYVLYFEDTQDQKYLTEAISGLDPSYLKTLKL